MPEHREQVNRGALRFLAWVLAAMALLAALPAVSAEWTGGETVPELGEIRGVVFNDLNQDGEWNHLDTGEEPIPEEPLAGATVSLRRVQGEGPALLDVETNDDGAYAFGGLVPGEYELAVEPPLGYRYSEELGEFRQMVTIGAPPQAVEVNVPFILLLGPPQGNHRLHLPLVRR